MPTKRTTKRTKRRRTKRMFWSEKDIKTLIRLYPNKINKDIAKIMGVSVSRIENKGWDLGLKKSKKQLSKMVTKQFLKAGNKTRFKKGQVAINKGKKWKDYMPKESQKNCRKTTFKKGNLPHNTKKDGVISIRKHTGKDGTVRKYKYIRVGLAHWKLLHVYNWEKKHGVIPKGSIVVFKNKYSDSCEVDNLEMITLEENMNRNAIHRFPEELQKTIRVLSKLKRTVNGKEQNRGSEESPVRNN